MDVVLAIVIALGIAFSVASLAAAIRKLMWVHLPNERARAPVSVILPLTGPQPGLVRLVRAVATQTLRPRRLIIVVEAEADPAHASALKAQAKEKERKDGLTVEIVVAGEATHQAQKCHNQQAALKRIGGSDEIIVLMDGDIRPHPKWLSGLVAPITDEGFDIVSAHRWQQVTAPRLGAHLVTAIDRAVTLMPRLDAASTRVVWGGSSAISTDAALHMDLRGSLSDTLSDDLSISQRAAEVGLRSVTRGMLFVASPTGQSCAPAWRFARRQYQICHIYRPWLWRLALFTIGLRLTAWAAAVTLLLTRPDAEGWALAALVLLSGLGLAKQFAVGRVARRVGLPDPASVRLGQLALGIAQPLVDLFHFSVILAAGWTRTVRWGHVTYEIKGPNRIRVTRREPFSR